MKSAEPLSMTEEENQSPDFNELIQAIFRNNGDAPDFVFKRKGGETAVYLDKATKLDIILSTVYNLNEGNAQMNRSEEGQNR